MFGAFGLPELLVILVVVGFASALVRGSGSTTPVLVLRRFDVRPSDAEAVTIEGRPSGLMAWLLTSLGIDTLTTLIVTDRHVTIRTASASGQSYGMVPIAEIASTACRYHQPVWLLVVAAIIVVGSVIVGIASRDAAATILGGIVVAAILGITYLLQRKFIITVESIGGTRMGLAFKRSVIEHVSVDLRQALMAVNRINALVLAKTQGR